MTINPAKDFAESQVGKSWQSVVGETQFQEAAKAAMLVAMDRFAHEPDPSKAGLMLQGAQAFLRELMSLGETPKPRTPQPDTLNLKR